MTKQTAFIIFITALAVNVVWEAFHYRLYIPVHPVSQMPGITVVAALLDAFWVLMIFAFFRSGLKIRLIAAFLLALLIEQWAMVFNIWQYGNSMPIVPALAIGLSPLIQLMATVLIAEFFLKMKIKKMQKLR